MKVMCPNILSSIYAQEKLRDESLCELLGDRIQESQTFTIVFPPCYCRGKARYFFSHCPVHNDKDIPLIVRDNGMGKIEEYTDLFDAIGFLKLTNRMHD